MSAALIDVPLEYRKGGMKIRYVDASTGQYVHWFNKNSDWSNTPSDWYGELSVSQNNQTGGYDLKLGLSKYNIAKQNAIKETVTVDADLEFADNNGGAVAQFKDGHIKTKNFDSRKHQQEDSEKDLEFIDSTGGCALEVDGGHIKTKYFDSRHLPISLIDKFKGKKLAILGDSISTFKGWCPSDIVGYTGATYAYYYGRSDIVVLPNYDIRGVQDCWWYILAQKLGLNPLTDLNNCAWSGSKVSGNSLDTQSAYAGCSNRRISDLSIRGYNPDIILVFISCNDWGTDVSLGNWSVNDNLPNEGVINEMKAAYAIMLNKIYTQYPMARIFCATILDDKKRDADVGYPSKNNNGVTTYQWNQAIIELAESFGCDLMDFHNCGMNYGNIVNYVVDEGLHPNRTGQLLLAEKAFNCLISKY